MEEKETTLVEVKAITTAHDFEEMLQILDEKEWHK